MELPDDEALDLINTRKAIRAKSTDCMKDLSSPPRDKMMRKNDTKQKQKKRNHRSEAPTGAHGK